MIPKLLQASRSDFFTRLPISTSALTSLNTAASPLAEALDFRYIQDLGEKGNLGALLAGFTGYDWEKEKQVLFSTFTSQGFHTMLMNLSNPDGSSSSTTSENSSPEPQIDCGTGVKMITNVTIPGRVKGKGKVQDRGRVKVKEKGKAKVKEKVKAKVNP